MPASLPGATLAQNLANPSQGTYPVIFDLLSGPKGSPFDKDTISGTTNNASTGALCTGIGFGGQVIDPISNPLVSNSLYGINRAGFTDDYVPGVSRPSGVAATDSTLMYIGGGRSNANGTPSPYTAGFGIGMAGGGGSRDAGAGPAFTGFTCKTVTATGACAVGAAIEAGFINRSSIAMVANQSSFGSSNTASAAVA